MRARVAAGVLALAALCGPLPAGAANGGQGGPGDARARAESLRAELTGLLRDLAAASLAADDAGERWMWLRLRQMEAQAAERAARADFEERVRAAYMGGGARAAEMLLGAASFRELTARLPFAEAILAKERLDVGEVVARRRALSAALHAADDAQREVAQAEGRFVALRDDIERRLARAEAEVRDDAAALAVVEGERRRYAGTLDEVAGATRSIRRQRGEAMFAAAARYLGPRADCSVPEGLASTGDQIAGEASWYGNEFKGKPTASGAIFDPARYTVAHRTLPFGLFLLIRMDGRCVVSFLNDRGPYVDGRILDLSYASAQAIGLSGAKDVTATLLVRAS
jgi:rare lipoprotein A